MKKQKKTDKRKEPKKFPAPKRMFDGCAWVSHDGSHCGKPCVRFRDMCDVHGMLVC
jgi:hypothetical protein